MGPNSSSAQKVRKPRPDFPLFPHATGRWAKKVRGKFVFFGKTATDPDGQVALNLWLDQKDDLLAGRTPRAKSDGLTMRDMCNRFLTAKELQRRSGELSDRPFQQYKQTTDKLISQFGLTRLVSDLASDDFEALRATLSTTLGPVSLGNEIQRIRVVFKYAYDAGLVAAPMRYGPMFKRPSRKMLRIQRAKNGPKMFEAADVRRLLDLAGPQLRAMILLAINCGFGNSDCASLPMTTVDLEKGWVDFPRPKMGVARRCPLWPETVEALRKVLANRKDPKSSEHSGLLFVTKRGGSFDKETSDNPVAKEFSKIVKTAGLQRKGRGFYALRHTFRTIADGSRDQPACDHVMGHARDDMASVYRERIDDARLEAVVGHVRLWLFVKEKKDKAAKEAKPRQRAP